MKKNSIQVLCLALIAAGLFLSTLSHAQVPQKFNYQGIARDIKGNPIGKQTLALKLSVLPTEDASVAEYEETQTVTTNEFGLYTLQIGNGSPLIGDMKTVKWETGNKYIRVAIDPKGGSDYTVIGTSQLLSVPYAIYADKAGLARETVGQDGKTRTGAVSSNAAHVAGDANYVTKFTALNTIGKSLIYDNGARVGIGTTTPLASGLLHLKSAIGTQPLILESPQGVHNLIQENGINRGYFGSYIGSGGAYPTPAGTSDADFDIGTSGASTGKLHFATNTTPRLTILPNTGFVGIGTTTPAAKLDVMHNSNYVAQFNGTSSMYMGLFEDGIYRGYLGSYAGNAEDVDFGTGASNSLGKVHLTIGAIPRFTVANDGNIGVATTSPTARMDIVGVGTTSSTNNFMIRNSLLDTIIRVRDDGRMGIGYNGSSYGRTMNLGGTGINFYTANEAAFGGAIFPTDTSLVLWSNSASNNYLVLQPSWGNTGVGTYTPNAKLHLNGNMLIGSNSANPATGYKLSVDGDVIAENYVTLPSTSWPDYVFDEKYKLMPLNELEQSIKSNKHLPKIPAAQEMETNGINLGNMAISLTEKVEELTLYIIELNKKNEELRNQLNKLELEVNKKK